MDCSIGGQNSLSLSLSALLSTESAVVSCFNVKYSATRCLFTKNAKIDRKCQNQSFSPFFRGNAFLQVWNMVWWIIMVFPVVVWRIFLLFCLDTLSWVRNYTFFVTRREDIKKEMMGVIEHKRYWQWCVSEKWKEKILYHFSRLEGTASNYCCELWYSNRPKVFQQGKTIFQHIFVEHLGTKA